MSFGAEMKDFLGGFQAGTKFWDDRDRAKLERAQTANLLYKNEQPNDANTANMPGFTPGENKVGYGDSSGNKAMVSNDIAWTDAPPEARALLNTIAGPESGGAYNIKYGGGTFDDFSQHPGDSVGITSGPNAGKTSSAAGRYQFLGSTYKDLQRRYGLNDFSPANQDKAAWYYANEVYGRNTGGRDLSADLKSGDPNLIASVGKNLSSAWTSLPSGIEQGTNTNAFVSNFDKNLQRPVQTANAPSTGGTTANAAPVIPAAPAAAPAAAAPAPPATPATPSTTPAPAAEPVKTSQAAGTPAPQQFASAAPTGATAPPVGGFSQTQPTEAEAGPVQPRAMSAGAGVSRVADAMLLTPEEQERQRQLQSGRLFADKGGVIPDDLGTPDIQKYYARGGVVIPGMGDPPPADVTPEDMDDDGLPDWLQPEGGVPPAPADVSAIPASRADRAAAVDRKTSSRKTKDDAVLPTAPEDPRKGQHPKYLHDQAQRDARVADAKLSKEDRDVASDDKRAVKAAAMERVDNRPQPAKQVEPPPEKQGPQRPLPPPDTAATRVSRAAPPVIPSRMAAEDRAPSPPPEDTVAAYTPGAPGEENAIDPNADITQFNPKSLQALNPFSVTGQTPTNQPISVSSADVGAIPSAPAAPEARPSNVPDGRAVPNPNAAPTPVPPEARPSNVPDGQAVPNPNAAPTPGVLPENVPIPAEKPVTPAQPGVTAPVTAAPATAAPRRTAVTPRAPMRVQPAPQGGGTMRNAGSSSDRIYSGSTADQVRRSQPANPIYNNPRSQGVARQATHGALGFLSHIFGFDGSTNAGAIPSRQQGQNVAGMRRFMSGEGASSPQEIKAVYAAVDPNNEMSTHDKTIQALSKTYQFYMSRGRKAEASAAAANLLQYGSNQVSHLGALANESYGQFLQNKNPAALDHTLQFLNRAYEYIPNGAQLDLHVDKATNQIVLTHTEDDGTVNERPVRPDELQGLVQGTMNKSLYWKMIYETADPAGAHQAWTQEAQNQRSERTQERQDQRQQQTHTWQLEREGRVDAAKKEAEAQKQAAADKKEAAKKAEVGNVATIKPLEDKAIAAQAALDKDPENQDLIAARNAAASEAADAMPPKEVEKRFTNMGLPMSDWQYVGKEKRGAPARAAPPRPAQVPPAAKYDAKSGKWWAPDASGKMTVVG